MADTRRLSNRWANTPRPNFKDMCDGKLEGVQHLTPPVSNIGVVANGSESNGAAVGGSVGTKPKSGKMLWEGFRCTLYEDVMKQMKAYEKACGCKLNASMITLKSRQGRPDYLYYRYLIFWCNYCPTGNKSSLALHQRYCPFVAVVTGDPATQSLCLSQIYTQHRHLDHISPEVRSDQAIPRGLPPGFGAPPPPPSPAPPPPAPPKSASRMLVVNGDSSSSSTSSKRVGKNKVPPVAPLTPIDSPMVNPTTSKKRFIDTSQSVKETVKKKTKLDPVCSSSETVDEDYLVAEAVCQLCSFKSHSKNAFCGHCWLVHKILTDVVTVS